MRKVALAAHLVSDEKKINELVVLRPVVIFKKGSIDKDSCVLTENLSGKTYLLTEQFEKKGFTKSKSNYFKDLAQRNSLKYTLELVVEGYKGGSPTTNKNGDTIFFLLKTKLLSSPTPPRNGAYKLRFRLNNYFSNSISDYDTTMIAPITIYSKKVLDKTY